MGESFLRRHSRLDHAMFQPSLDGRERQVVEEKVSELKLCRSTLGHFWIAIILQFFESLGRQKIDAAQLVGKGERNFYTCSVNTSLSLIKSKRQSKDQLIRYRVTKSLFLLDFSLIYCFVPKTKGNGNPKNAKLRKKQVG